MMKPEKNEPVYRQAMLDEIIELRERILIRGTQRHSPYFEGDRNKDTLHFGAFLNQANIACLTFLPTVWEGEPAWQLRGMACDPQFRGLGYGARLLDYAESVLIGEWNACRLWCNARTAATGFYLKQGWQIASDEFSIAGVGPHYKMTKTINK